MIVNKPRNTLLKTNSLTTAPKRFFSALSLLAIFFVFDSAFANSQTPMDVVIRTGMMTGSFQGQDVKNGTFTTDVTMEAELWLYQSSQQATVLHMILGNESGIGRARYFGAGGGKRYFIGGEGLMTDQKTGSDFVQIKPNWSYYIGWDIHMAQFLVAPLSDVLASYTTLADIGGVGGVKRVISPNYSVDATLGYTFGYSVSSAISLTTSIIRVMVGVGYSF